MSSTRKNRSSLKRRDPEPDRCFHNHIGRLALGNLQPSDILSRSRMPGAERDCCCFDKRIATRPGTRHQPSCRWPERPAHPAVTRRSPWHHRCSMCRPRSSHHRSQVRPRSIHRNPWHHRRPMRRHCRRNLPPRQLLQSWRPIRRPLWLPFRCLRSKPRSRRSQPLLRESEPSLRILAPSGARSNPHAPAHLLEFQSFGLAPRVSQVCQATGTRAAGSCLRVIETGAEREIESILWAGSPFRASTRPTCSRSRRYQRAKRSRRSHRNRERASCANHRRRRSRPSSDCRRAAHFRLS
jgi:hypothetical protein